MYKSTFSEGKSIEEKNKKEIKPRSHLAEHHTDSLKEAKEPMSGRTVKEIGGQLAVSQRSQNTAVNQE